MFLAPLAAPLLAHAGAMSVASTVMGAGSALVQGFGAYQQGNAEADLAKQNATIARGNADQAIDEAGSAEAAQRRDGRKQLGQLAAQFAQSGGSAGDGADVIRQSATDAELDALNIRYGGQREAYGYQTDAASLDAQAVNAKRNAKGALIGSALGAAGKLLAGGGDYAQIKAGQAMRAPVVVPSPRRA